MKNLAKTALSDLQKGKAWPVYYLYGEEPFKIQEFVSKVRETLFGEGADSTFCEDKLDGAQANGNDVLEAVQSMGLFGGGGARRLVIVRQAHLLKATESLANALTEQEFPFGENVLLLVAESLDGRKKFHQWLKKKGYALEFTAARDAELAQWVDYLAKKYKATVSPEAAQMLALLSDGSLYRLSQEIEKAWLYAGGTAALTIEAVHVTATAAHQISHEMVELVSAIFEGKRTRALLLTEQLITGSEDALGLVGFLTWALKNPQRFVQTKKPEKLLSALVELDLRLKSSGSGGPDVHAQIEQFVIENTAL